MTTEELNGLKSRIEKAERLKRDMDSITDALPLVHLLEMEKELGTSLVAMELWFGFRVLLEEDRQAIHDIMSARLLALNEEYLKL